MTAQYIELGNRGWSILVYYDIYQGDLDEIADSLLQFGCSDDEIDELCDNLMNLNTGFTVSDNSKKMSIVGIGTASNRAQFLNTVVHEINHVQAHICDYYNIDKDSEQAAYLIGYIAQRMYRALSMFMKYGRL